MPHLASSPRQGPSDPRADPWWRPDQEAPIFEIPASEGEASRMMEASLWDTRSELQMRPLSSSFPEHSHFLAY